MHDFPEKLLKRLDERASMNALRALGHSSSLVDFSSNDYLGFAKNIDITNAANELLKSAGNGSTGSRLITGNHRLYQVAEETIATFHQAGSALMFNSGYDANLGVFSSIPQRGDFVFFDEYCHASIRDGLRLSQATCYKFGHNDLEELGQMLAARRGQTLYVATESVFSMDGDSPPLVRLVELCEEFGAHLIIDEAHALGVFGKYGTGLVQEFALQDRVFARIMTFGKALGCHGAAVLGPKMLSRYLTNFARSFIYTTGLSPHAVATVISAYEHLGNSTPERDSLQENILHFSRELARLGLGHVFVGGKSAIASAIIPGNEKVRAVAASLQAAGFDVRPILSPTVPQGQERLRFCIHSYNTPADISAVLELLANQMFT